MADRILYMRYGYKERKQPFQIHYKVRIKIGKLNPVHQVHAAILKAYTNISILEK